MESELESILIKIISGAIVLLVFFIKDLYSKNRYLSLKITDLDKTVALTILNNQHIESKLEEMDGKLNQLLNRNNKQ